MTATAIMIPARHASARFPGKPLTPLAGPDGARKPLIQWTWEAAMRAADGVPVFVLTDDERIAAAAAGFGGQVITTPATCRNGTERCAAALAAVPEAETVVNFQGDSPLMPLGAVRRCVRVLADIPGADMATPVFRAEGAVRAALLADAAEGRVGGTTAQFDRTGRALAFSKHVLPYGAAQDERVPVYLHLGLYAYRRQALADYPRLPVPPAETAEGLEQLRALHAGYDVRAVEIDPPRAFWEVNNPHDVPLVEAALAAQDIG